MTVSGRGSDKRRLKVATASGEPATLDEMVRQSPRQVDLRRKAEGVLFGVSPKDAVTLVEELHATLDQHGCGHAEVRAYERRRSPRPHKELAQGLRPQDTAEVWLCGLLAGAVSKLW